AALSEGRMPLAASHTRRRAHVTEQAVRRGGMIVLQHLRWLVLAPVVCALPSWAAAEQVRHRFVPTDAYGTTKQVPVGPDGAMGELRRGFGAVALPYPCVVRPNQIVTFRHTTTCRNVTVPLRLPQGTPRMEHR